MLLSKEFVVIGAFLLLFLCLSSFTTLPVLWNPDVPLKRELCCVVPPPNNPLVAALVAGVPNRLPN